MILYSEESRIVNLCIMELKGLPLPVYRHSPGTKLEVTEKMKTDFDANGFIIIRNLFSKDEISKLKRSLEAEDSALMKRSYQESDGDGGIIKMILWNQPGEDYSGMMGRCEKMVETCEMLLEGEIFHYSSKMILKDAYTGGTFQWHQDYGYWYLNGMLRPDMMSVQVSIDEADRGNGCLQVLRGSHKMGRIDHGRVGDQAGADRERVEQAQKVMEKVYVETKEGDALFFHCNLLHRSDQNKSSRRRWVLISCYNRADNDAYKDHSFSRYTPLKKIPDTLLQSCQDFTTMEGKRFHIPNRQDYEYIPRNEEKA